MTVNPSDVQQLNEHGSSASPALIDILGQLAEGVGGGTLLTGWTQADGTVDTNNDSLDLGTGDLVCDDITAADDITATGDLNIGAALNHDGSTAGFYGHAPATKPVVPLTSPTVAHVITALLAIGLIAQSD